jgi:hypothetical protein
MTLAPVSSSELFAELGEEFQQLSNDLDTVDQNADTILTALTNSVRTKAIIAKGGIVVHFKTTRPELSGNWLRFLDYKGLAVNTVSTWENAYKCYEEHKDYLSDETLFGFGANILASLYKGLAFNTRVQVLESGRCNITEAKKLTSDPEHKLLKAEEDLEKAKAKSAEALTVLEEYEGPRNVQEPDYVKRSNDRRNSERSVKTLEAKIAKLKEQIQLEQDKTSAAEAAKDKAEEQLNQVMFDEKTSKELQVKRVGYNLQNMVPQVLADSQRYISEKANYPEDLRFHLDQQLTQLLTYLQTHYGSKNCS